jgi:cytochrome c biogenesis protein CcdA
MELPNLLAAFAYGLSSSLSLCLASCLPFYMPILLGYGEDRRKGLVLSLGFAAGRFAGYFTLGSAAALMGGAFIGFFSNDFPRISTLVIFLFGLLTVFYGFLVLARAQTSFLGERRCRIFLDKAKPVERPLLGTAILGFVSTITPCVPVFTFLLLPFALGKVWETALVTVAFGLGANAAFVAIGVAVGFGVENVRERFNALRRPLETAGAAVLVVFGLFYMAWALGPSVFNWGNPSYSLPTIYDFAAFVREMTGL